MWWPDPHRLRGSSRSACACSGTEPDFLTADDKEWILGKCWRGDELARDYAVTLTMLEGEAMRCSLSSPANSAGRSSIAGVDDIRSERRAVRVR